MNNEFLFQIPGIEPDEAAFLDQVTKDLNANQKRNFVGFYIPRRQKADTMLIFTLIGLLGVAGIQRFVIGQVGMGILYFLTGGLCLIGTIVDVVNHKSMTFEYNQKIAYEAMKLTQMAGDQNQIGGDIYYNR